MCVLSSTCADVDVSARSMYIYIYVRICIYMYIYKCMYIGLFHGSVFKIVGLFWTCACVQSSTCVAVDVSARLIHACIFVYMFFHMFRALL